MSLTKSILIGHANGDIHTVQVLDRQDVSQLATEEAGQIGKLTNAGFRTIVAAVWTSDEKKTAGLTYAAAWNENDVEVLLHHGDKIATSKDLYAHCIGLNGKALTSANLAEFCKKLKRN
jgi:hypothetical protein